MGGTVQYILYITGFEKELEARFNYKLTSCLLVSRVKNEEIYTSYYI